MLPMLNDPAAGFRVRTVGVSREPVMSAGGLTIVPDLQLADLEPTQSALLILPGSDSWARGYFGEAIEKASAFLAAEVPVAAICGATAGLAIGGLLDNRPHTSNAREYLQALGYGGGAFYQDQRVVTDGNLITANATAPSTLPITFCASFRCTARVCWMRGMACLRPAIRRTSMHGSRRLTRRKRANRARELSDTVSRRSVGVCRHVNRRAVTSLHRSRTRLVRPRL